MSWVIHNYNQKMAPDVEKTEEMRVTPSINRQRKRSWFNRKQKRLAKIKKQKMNAVGKKAEPSRDFSNNNAQKARFKDGNIWRDHKRQDQRPGTSGTGNEANK